MITAIQNNNIYEIRFPYDPNIVELIKNVPGRWWEPNSKMWTIPSDKLGFLVNQLRGTEYESQLYVQSTERINQNESLDATAMIPNIDISHVNFSVKDGCKPFKHQLDFMKFAIDRQQRGNSCGFILADQPGAGKAFTLDTKIYTPTGYKYMKDIQVGDKVFNELGQPVEVLATYDHDSLDMYKVTFSDNKQVTCCKDHLWTVLNNSFQPTTCSLSQIIDGSWRYQKNRKGYDYTKVFIPRCKPVQFEAQTVPLDPYLLGALLGDGSLTSSTIGFSTADKEMIDRLNDCLPDGYHLHSTPSQAAIDYTIVRKVRQHNTLQHRNEVRTALKSLNLEGTNSHTKFVPEIYKYNTPEVRLSVLQGLIDTDGYVNNTNEVVYTTVSNLLKDDVVFLVESLGQVCKETFNCRTNSWDVRIQCDDPTIFCRLSRKKSKLTKRRFTPRRRFKSIEYLGKMPGKCITVSGDSKLYLCEHFIVTHNTLQVMNLGLYNRQYNGAKHCLIVCCVNSAKYNWHEDIIKHTNGKEVPYVLGSRLKRDKISLRYDTGGAEKLKDLETGHMYGKEDAPELPYFLIVNIEAFRYKQGKYYTFTREVIKWVNDGKIGLIALDEIHRNTSPSSKQGQQILEIKKKATKNIEWIPMTGTPITSKPTDVFLPLRLVNGHNSFNYSMWCKEFCIFGGFGDYEIVGYKNMDKLKSMLQPNMLRRLKKDILDLPPKITYTEYIENSDYQKKLYSAVEEDLKKKKPQLVKSNNPLLELLKLRQVSGSPELVDNSIKIDDSYLSKNAKLSRLLELIDEIVENGEKVIVFSNWVEPLRTLYTFVSKRYKTCCYTGTMKADAREQNKRVFINNPNYPVLLGTVGAMGVSHTLTVARNIIFYDEPWNPSDREQCEDRCHRPGTTQSVNIYTLISKDTVDEAVHKIISTKEGVANYIVDNDLDVRNHPEVLDLLLGEITKL